MSLVRGLRITQKDLRLGPRSPLFAWVVVLPLVLTFLINVVFGTLFEPPPRLAVVDRGGSAVTAALMEAEGLRVSVLDDEAALRRAVEANDHDAGLVLPAGFDAALASGAQPPLELYVSGSSLASTRVVIGATLLQLVRDAAGQSPPVEVVLTQLGDEDGVPVADRLLPLVVIYAVMIAALFLPAASLVDEREKRTLDAVLVTPTQMREVLLGKAVLGVLLALSMGLVTLAVNDAFAGQATAMTVFLLLGSAMLAEIGLVLGCWARDSTTLFSAIKGGGILVILPVVFFLFPDLPQWIPRLTPTYYFLAPIYELSTAGTTLGDHLPELVIGVAICVALLPAVVAMGRRAERRTAVEA